MISSIPVVPTNSFLFWGNQFPPSLQLTSPRLSPQFIQCCLQALMQVLKPCLEFHHYSGNFKKLVELVAKQYKFNPEKAIPIIHFSSYEHLHQVAQHIHFSSQIDPAAFDILSIAAETSAIYQAIVKHSKRDLNEIVCYLFCQFGNKMIGHLMYSSEDH